MRFQPQKLFLLLLTSLNVLQTLPLSAAHQTQSAARIAQKTQSVQSVQSPQSAQTIKVAPATTPAKKEALAPLPPVIHTQGVRISAPSFAHGDSRHLQLQLDSVLIGLQLRPDEKDSTEFSITQLKATVESSELKGCTAGVLSVEKRGRSYTIILAVNFDPGFDPTMSGGAGAISLDLTACTLSKKTQKVSIPAKGSINFFL